MFAHLWPGGRPALDHEVAALDKVVFEDLRIVGGYHGGEPTIGDRFLVHFARRPL